MSAIKRDIKQSFLIFFHVLKCSFYCYSLLYLIDYFFTDLDIWGYRNNYNAFIFIFILIFGPTSYFYIDYLLTNDKKKWKENVKMRWKLSNKYSSGGY